MIPIIIQPKHTKAFILTHLGLGDIIMCNGLVRYIWTLYDEVKVVVKHNEMDTVQEMYKDLKNLTFYPVQVDANISPNYGCPMQIYIQATQDYDVYSTGTHILGLQKYPDFNLFPLCFYDDVDIPRHFFWTKSFIPRTHEAEELYSFVKNTPYVFMHNETSHGILFSEKKAIAHFKIDVDTTLIINPHRNVYSVGHPFYDLAQRFLKKYSLISYSYILENSVMNIMTDSCFFCLCHLLRIKHDKNYVVTRNFNFSHLYERETYPTKENFEIQAKFTQLQLE